MDYKEIEQLSELRGRPSLDRCVLQGLDLREAEAARGPTIAVTRRTFFLGCQLLPEDETRAARARRDLLPALRRAALRPVPLAALRLGGADEGLRRPRLRGDRRRPEDLRPLPAQQEAAFDRGRARAAAARPQPERRARRLPGDDSQAAFRRASSGSWAAIRWRATASSSARWRASPTASPVRAFSSSRAADPGAMEAGNLGAFLAPHPEAGDRRRRWRGSSFEAHAGPPVPRGYLRVAQDVVTSFAPRVGVGLGLPRLGRGERRRHEPRDPDLDLRPRAVQPVREPHREAVPEQRARRGPRHDRERRPGVRAGQGRHLPGDLHRRGAELLRRARRARSCRWRSGRAPTGPTRSPCSTTLEKLAKAGGKRFKARVRAFDDDRRDRGRSCSTRPTSSETPAWFILDVLKRRGRDRRAVPAPAGRASPPSATRSRSKLQGPGPARRGRRVSRAREARGLGLGREPALLDRARRVRRLARRGRATRHARSAPAGPRLFARRSASGASRCWR